MILGWLLIIALIPINRLLWLQLLGVGAIISLFIIAIGIVYWLAHIAWSGSRDPAKRAAKLAAQLLIATPRPYSKHRGLSYNELKFLQKTATIEQAAADWRSSFISIIIIGILFGLISSVLQPPSFWEEWKNIADAPLASPITLNVPWSGIELPPTYHTSLLIFNSVFWLFLLIILLLQLGRYYANFLATEPSNRLILFACAEALALLETHQLQSREYFTLPEKRYLAGQLGYKFHFGKSFASPIFEEAGRRWYLEPMSPSRLRRWLGL